VPLAVLVLDHAEESSSTSSSDELALGVGHFHPDVSFQLSGTRRVWRQESRACARVQKRLLSCARSGIRLGFSPENSVGLQPSRLCQLLRLPLCCHGALFCHHLFRSSRLFLQLRFSTLEALSLRFGTGALCRSVFHLLWRGSRRRSRPRRATPSTPAPPRGQVGVSSQLRLVEFGVMSADSPLQIAEDNSAAIAQAQVHGLRHVRNAKHYEVRLAFTKCLDEHNFVLMRDALLCEGSSSLKQLPSPTCNS